MKFWNPNESIFAGMTTAQLQAALTSAQQAYIALCTGTKGVDFAYTQGNGAKHVRYTETDLSKLVALIQELRAQLGQTRRARRPIGFIYR